MADEPEAVDEQKPIEEKPADETNQPLDAKAFHLKVYSPYEVYFDDLAQSLTAENDTGEFDILPKHHNFMTLVNEGEVVIRVTDVEDKKLRIVRGVLHVRKNKVTLFLDV